MSGVKKGITALYSAELLERFSFKGLDDRSTQVFLSFFRPPGFSAPNRVLIRARSLKGVRWVLSVCVSWTGAEIVWVFFLMPLGA